MDIKAKRRWFAFRLRTLLVVVAVLSLPIAWAAYNLDWIRRRSDAFGMGYLDIINSNVEMDRQWASKPWPLHFWIANKFFGMDPCRYLYLDRNSPLTEEQAQKLFPEAIIH